MKALNSLSRDLALAEREQDAIAQLDALKTELEARETALLDTCDLNDKASFAELAEVRMKLEIAPRKRAALEARHGAACQSLSTALRAAFPLLHGLLSTKSDAVRQVISQQLRPIFASGADLSRHVDQAYRENEIAQRIENLGMSYEYSINEGDSEPQKVARKLLTNYTALEAITIPEKL